MLQSEVKDHVASITLLHPPVNALSRAWADTFNGLIDDLERRTDWRVLVIRSGLKLFSAGGDLKEFAQRLADPKAGELLAREAAYYQELFARIESLPQISVAEIRGVAAGGGLELALACDLRIAAESARVGLPEVGVGLLPSAGGTQRLARLCGRGRAMRLIGCAELMPAVKAHEFGLVEWVTPDAEFVAVAEGIVRVLAEQPTAALRAAKRCISAAFDVARDGFAEEVEAPRFLMNDPETRTRIQAFVAKAKGRGG